MDKEVYEKRIEWFKNARFGMFIHWGLYAIPARGEWIRGQQPFTAEEYQVYFNMFDPVDYNPKEWARLAKQAGMKYAVLTTKHHDGFCLFDSKLTDFKATNTKAGRDLVREYVDAFRAEGLRVGFYYSLIDWDHPEYPHYGERNHPMRENEDYKDKKHDFDQYLDYMHGQVRELCTNYGQIDILWLDFSYDDKEGEAWRATELVNMVRELQPGILIDNRMENGPFPFGSSLMTDNPMVYSGDFISPEQLIPPDAIKNLNGDSVCWEACVTLNNHWGYHEGDNDYKSAQTIVRKLVECVSKGGNLLINVGPNAKGALPKAYFEVFGQVGKWMADNHESIYGCGECDLPKPPWGYFTRKGNKIYLHVLEQPVGPLPIRDIKKDDIGFVKSLASGAELNFSGAWTTCWYPDYTFISYGAYNSEPSFTYELPDEIDTVIEVTLK